MTNRLDNQLEAVKVDEKECPCNCGAILPTGVAEREQGARGCNYCRV